VLNLRDALGKDLVMSAEVRAFTPTQRPRFQTLVKVNGSQVAVWNFDAPGEEPVQREAIIPKSLVKDATLRVILDNSDPRSPSEFGINSDTRKLSLALTQMTIRPR
jgi:hypothetical protein